MGNTLPNGAGGGMSVSEGGGGGWRLQLAGGWYILISDEKSGEVGVTVYQ